VVGGTGWRWDRGSRGNQGGAGGGVAYDAVRLERGDELGRFLLGSTAIVLTTAAAGLVPCVVPGSAVRMGQALHRSRAAGVA